jgi:hypothetical protein
VPERENATSTDLQSSRIWSIDIGGGTFAIRKGVIFRFTLYC